MSEGLTRRQQEILDFILSEVESKGYPPSVREIGAAVGLSSSSTVHSHLAALERKGCIKRDPSKPRALLLADHIKPCEKGSVKVPLLGQVAAGQPILAAENIEDQIIWPENFNTTPAFALRIKGDSMIEDGIFNDDIVMVRQQNTADNGDTVVALIEDEATVKRFYREGSRVRLDPANKNYEPFYPESMTILGRVVGLLRTL